MPVRPPRRLDLAPAQGLYDSMRREALHAVWGRNETDQIAREHPELIIERDGNLLAALRTETTQLAYSYRSDRAFTEHFPVMFETLLRRIRRILNSDTVRFRLGHGPSRPVVEPVLRNLSFKPGRNWLSFSLDRAAAPPKVDKPRGATLREGGIEDIDALVRLDRGCFPDAPTPALALRGQIEDFGDRVLIADTRGVPVGYAMYSSNDGAGYLHALGVNEDSRGRRIASALTLRVAKTVFAEGAERLDLKTEEDNSSAIRLYVGLGFLHVGAGRDYERPADPKVIERMRNAEQGTLIRFGGWR